MPEAPYAPAINVGFLYDISDHCVDFTRPDDGVDLMVRFEADPKENKDCKRVMDLLGQGRLRLAQEEAAHKHRTRVRLRDEPGNGNRWSLLIAQKCLTKVLEGSVSETDQLHAIYDYFRHFFEALFRDPELEQALRTLRPYGGTVNINEGRATGWPHQI